MAINLKHQSFKAFIDRLRLDYANSEGDRTIHIGQFILNHIQTGDLIEADLRTAFGKSAGSWTTFKTKLQNNVNARNSVRSARGE